VRKTTLTQHLEKHIAKAFLQLTQEIMKTWQLTKPILLKSLDNIKRKLAHTNLIMMPKLLNQPQPKLEPQMAAVVIEEEDEPVGPRRMADDERPEDAQLKTSTPVATPVTALSEADQNNIELRKLRLEERRFELEEKKEFHKMAIEDRHEDQKEDEIAYERAQIAKDESKKEEKASEHWMKAYWRPAMGWLYMLICFFDFVVAPVLSMLMPIFLKGLGANTVTYTQWQSLTLANGGLIHLAFGAILGVTAWGRTQEKNAANNAANAANGSNKPSGGSIATT
jgi:Holin of 3TMs, for gene-transfer release